MKLEKILFTLLVPCIMSAADPKQTTAGDQSANRTERRADYVLQADDEITVHSIEVKELSDKVFRLDQNVEANFPLIGRISLSGKTVVDAESTLAERVKKYYIDPDIELSVAVLHTEPVSVIGAIGTPGVHLMKGKMTLLDALSAAGGVRPDAGPLVVVTREEQYGPIPYAGSRLTTSGDSVAEVNLKDLLDGVNPDNNFAIQPHDVISVPLAQLVYVEGNVKRAGGFVLSGKVGLSVSQALALAEGLDARANAQKAHILRRDGETKQLIPVNLKLILAGTAEDVTLKPNDVLFVPNSTTKTVTARTIEAAIAIGSGLLIFH